MTTYTSEDAAAADGFVFAHEPERNRFVITLSDRVIGEAHYRFLGDDDIDFDHTFVTPAYRGTGLSELLAHRAVTDPITEGRRRGASCWFIEGYLARHPEVRSDEG